MVRYLDFLESKLKGSLSKLRSVRKPLMNDVFKRVLYILPQSIKVTSYVRSRPLASFNPGAIIKGNDLLVFPRLIFDYYWYVSSIGLFKLSLKDILNGRGTIRELPTRIVIYPTNRYEVVRGCEDPRIHVINGKYYVLYTAVGPKPMPKYTPDVISDMPLYRASYQALAVLDEDLKLISKYYLKVGNEVVPNWKDGSIIKAINSKSASMLLRPLVSDVEANWRGVINLRDFSVELSSLEPVMVAEDWEFKVGWSTNTVRLSSNEYLVGWHAVLKSNFSYVEGLAIVDDSGDLLATTDYVLVPKGLNELFGDRPSVIFGCGLVLTNEYVIWVGGVADYCIGVFKADLSKVLELMKWVRG